MINLEEKNSFVLYTSYEEQLSFLTDEECGQLLKAIITYVKTQKREKYNGALGMAYSFICSQIERDMQKYNNIKEKRKEAGKRSAQARQQRSAKSTSVKSVQQTSTSVKSVQQTSTNPTVNVNGNENVNVDGNVNGNENVNGNVINDINIYSSVDTTPKLKKIKHKYGEYKNVLLSDEDMEKLKTEFPNDYLNRIERLSEYIASTGKKYKSHLATLRAWARKETPVIVKKEPELKIGGMYL